MRFKLTLILFFLFAALSTSAQNTSVTGTVVDSGGQSWNNGSYNFTFQGATTVVWQGGGLGRIITGTLSASGAIGAVNVPDVNTISPGGSQWRLTVCSATIPQQCFTQNLTITGASQVLTVTPPAISITISNSPVIPPPFVSAYADAEISGGWQGFQYYNSVSTAPRVCSVATIGITGPCTTFIAAGGTGLPTNCTGVTGSITCSTSLIAGTVTSNHVTLSGTDGSSKCFQADGATLCIPSLIGGIGSVAGAGSGQEGWAPNTDDLMHWYIGGVDLGTEPVYLTGISGTDTYLSTSPVGALVKGQQYCFDPINTHTLATPTLNINSLGAKNILQPSGLLAGHVSCFVYNGSAFDTSSSSAPSTAPTIFASSNCAGALNCISVLNRGGFVWDATFTMSSGTVSFPNGDCTLTAANVGDQVFGTNAVPGGGTGQLTSSVIIPLGTISTVSCGSNQITVSTMASATLTGTGVLIWGPDETTALTSWSNAVYASCGKGVLPGVNVNNNGPAVFLVSSGIGNKSGGEVTTNCSIGTEGNRQGTFFSGQGWNATYIIPVPTPTFSMASCTGGFNGHGCFFSTNDGSNISDLNIWCGGNSVWGSGQVKAIVELGGDSTGGNLFVSRLSIMGCGAQWNSGTTGVAYGLENTNFDTEIFGSNIDGVASLCLLVESSLYLIDTGVADCQNGLMTVTGATNPNIQVFSNASRFCCVSSAANSAEVTVDNGGTLHSNGDWIGLAQTSSLNGVVLGRNTDGTSAGNGTIYLNGTVIDSGTTASATGLYSQNSSIAYLANTVVNATGTSAKAINLNGTTKLFDNGGNVVTGTTVFTKTAGDVVFGSGSITGTAQTSGNWSVPAGSGAGQWGTTPSVACPGTLGASAGDSRTEFCTITVGSGTVGANPVLTITFPTAFFQAPSCDGKMVAGTATLQNFTSGVPSATSVALTYQGTPAASSTIGLKVTCQ